MTPTIRRSAFGFPADLGAPSEATVSMVDPIQGFHAGIAPMRVPPGFTPASQNLVVEDDALTPRSALSSFDSFGTNIETGIGGAEFSTVTGVRMVTLSSYSAIQVSSGKTFSQLSYVASTLSSVGSIGTITEPLSASLYDFFDATHVYDPGLSQNLVVAAAEKQWPKWFVATPSVTTYSDFTFFSSICSSARAVTAFDDRLVWFNTTDTIGDHVTRVLWSRRGRPVDYSVSDGAGFQDLFDMKGIGLRIIPESDGVILFSSQEVWRGRRRLDAYVFDFFPLMKKLGCPFAKTVVSTPYGVVFLASDMEVYLISGAEVTPLGILAGFPGGSRIQSWLRNAIREPIRAWGLYNSDAKRYELYFFVEGRNGTDALYYSFDNNSWLPQHFEHFVTYGVEGPTERGNLTWDDLVMPWDSYPVRWDDTTRANAMVTRYVSSIGTIHDMRSDVSNDDGTSIDCRWRTHAMAIAPLQYTTVSDFHMEYRNPSASSASLWLTSDVGASFFGSQAFPLSQSSGTATLVPFQFTALTPQVEMRWNDGGRPRIHRLYASLRADGSFSGAL